MPLHRTTIVLATLLALGLGHILFFEPRMKTTAERKVAEKRVLRIVASEIQRIKVRRDHWTSALIERNDGLGFRVVEPAATAVETRHVLRLLSMLEFAEKRTTFSGAEQAGQPRDYGLDPPELEISVATDEGREIHLAVGRPSAAGNGVYLKILGEDPIHVVDEELAGAANRLLDAAIGDAERTLEGARDDAAAPARAPGTATEDGGSPAGGGRRQ